MLCTRIYHQLSDSFVSIVADEKTQVMNEEKRLEQEIQSLEATLTKKRRNRQRLQEDYGTAMKAKSDMDAKLKQLSMLLHQDSALALK